MSFLMSEKDTSWPEFLQELLENTAPRGKVGKMSSPPTRWLRRALEVSGMLSTSTHRRLYAVYSCYHAASIAYCSGGGWAYFFTMEGAPTEKLQSVQVALTIFCGFMKLCNARIQEKKLNSLLESCDNLWTQMYDEPLNREIMERSARNFNLIFQIYKAFIAFAWVSNIVTPLVAHFFLGVTKLTLQILMPFDNEKYFVPIQIVQMSLALSPLLANTSSLLIYMVVSEQLSVYMKVLRRKLEDEKISKQTIQEHQEIIKIADITNDVFSWIIFFETTVISVELSTSAYLLYKVHIKGGNRDNIVMNVVNFVFCFFIPYVICYCGSKIETESENLFVDSYNGQWYEHDAVAKKDLGILMTGATRILNLQYRNIVVFGMELFTSIINLTFNVFNAIIWLEPGD